MCREDTYWQIIPSFDATGAAPGPAPASAGSAGQLGEVATAFGFGDQGAQVALAVRDGALLDLLDGALHLGFPRRLGLGEQDLANIARCAGSSTKSMGLGLANGERLEGREGAEALKPCGLLGKGFGRQPPRA